MKMNRLVLFAVSNFGPLIVFYLANQLFGLMVAVLSSVVWITGEIAFYISRRRQEFAVTWFADK
jgi:hypothetical protein